MMRSRSFPLGVAVAALLVQACGEATPPEPCLTGGTGSLSLTMTGAPAGVTASVDLTGPGGASVVTGTQTLTGIATGPYLVAPRRFTVADSLISRVFAGRVGSSTAAAVTVCVRDAATTNTTVTFSALPTSGRLWYGAGFYALGFSAAQLTATATLAPTATVGTRGGAGVTFDTHGNLWVRGQSASDPVLMRYPASALASTGNPLPDRTIGVSGLNCVSPGGLAFDAAGNLWLSLGCQGRIVRLTASQLATSGTYVPSVQITNLVNPIGIAFDATGNLWVADQSHLRRFNLARLGASITTAADLSVAFTTPSPPAPGQTGLQAFHLAFAPDGEFWVSSFEEKALYRVEPAVSAATGAQSATPTRIVYLNEFSMPKGFAFDNAGGLFIGYEQAKFARLSPAQLDANSTPAAPTTPERIFASGNILGFGDDIALFPAPATTPLFHRAP